MEETRRPVDKPGLIWKLYRLDTPHLPGREQSRAKVEFIRIADKHCIKLRNLLL